MGARGPALAQARGPHAVVLGAALRLHAPAVPGRPSRPRDRRGRAAGRRGACRRRHLHLPRVDEEEGVMANDYDVVVIGSGTGGYVAAIRAAQLGLRTGVVEAAPARRCERLSWGCIRTKALLEHAHSLKIAQDWKEWGLTIGDAAIGLDMNQVQARKDRIVKTLTGGVEFLFKKNKIDWIKGSGRLGGPGKVEITEGDKQTIAVKKEIIVATGSGTPGVPGATSDPKRIAPRDT